PSFWHKLAEIKTDFNSLNVEPNPICGYYSPREANSCVLEMDCTAFNSNFKEPKFCFKAHGTIYNKNTLENFKETDKTSLLQQEGLKLLEEFRTDIILEDPSRLATFSILSFAVSNYDVRRLNFCFADNAFLIFQDLQNYNYYYWFGFPSPLTLEVARACPPFCCSKNFNLLNLKLMKWRLLPGLNLNLLATTKCLLFGAGTLGCAVARILLGCGFKRITFVDSRKVRFSNPVCQQMYTHQDACKENIIKATTAAEIKFS
uniref:THIF-type NAD/FAD binding fold domain-containing protein n=1 Tax=Glossina austeni TaxID=7395 RepID=A0A1A9UWK3_GLOAU